MQLSSEDFLDYTSKKVYISNYIHNQSFNIVVKQNEYIKKGQKIFEKDGLFVASPVSGKVLNIKLDKNFFDELVYFVEIENDEKYDEIVQERPKVKNKDDVVLVCKNFGLVGAYDFVANIIKNFNKKLIVNAFDDKFVFNNFLMLKKHANLIFLTIEKLAKLCDYKTVIFCVSKCTKNVLKKLISENKSLLENIKIVIKTKQNLSALSLFDIYNLHNAFCGKMQTKLLVSFVGGAIKQNRVIFVGFGSKICDVISFLGGFKQNIEEIEDFKYMSLVAFNDINKLEQKVKQAKNNQDKQKLVELLNEKNKEAIENVFSKREEYHKKMKNCLSACFVNGKNSKILIKNFNLSIEFFCFAINLLSFEQFS